MQTIHVNISLLTRKVPIVDHEGTTGLNEIGEEILSRLKAYDPDKKIHLATAILSKLLFVDPKDREMEVGESLYNPYGEIEELCFVFGQILEVHHFTKSSCYIRCKYSDHGRIKTDLFQADADFFPEDLEEDEAERTPQYLIGTCVKKEYVPKKRASYNKRCRRSFQQDSKEAIKKVKNVIVRGAIVHG